MPVELQLIRDGRIVVHKYTEPLTMREIVQSVIKANAEFHEQAEEMIYSVFDLTGVTRLPSNILSDVSGLMQRIPQRSGTSFVATRSAFVKMIAEVFAKLRPGTIQIFSSLDDALAAVERLLAEEKEHA